MKNINKTKAKNYYINRNSKYHIKNSQLYILKNE